jgi:hypothetical protein
MLTPCCEVHERVGPGFPVLTGRGREGCLYGNESTWTSSLSW